MVRGDSPIPNAQALCSPTHWLSTIIYHPETSLRLNWLSHVTLVHTKLSPPLWLCSWLLLPGMPLFNTQLKSTSSREIFLSCQPQIMSLRQLHTFHLYIHHLCLSSTDIFKCHSHLLWSLNFALFCIFFINISSLKARILSYYPHISHSINNTQ